MAGLQSPLPINNSVLNYLRNACHVGAQRQERLSPSDNEHREIQDDERIDHVQISLKHGAEAGAQTGLAQHLGKKKNQGEIPGYTRRESKADSVDNSLSRSHVGTTPGPVAPPSGGIGEGASQASTATAAQTALNDSLQANQAYWSMAVERQKHWYKVFEALQDLQNEIMTFISEAAIKRAKIMDTIATRWASVLGDYELE